MKIGILADSHDNLRAIESSLEVFKKEKVDLLLHAGDIVAPFAIKAFFPIGKRIISVYGNNDGEKSGLKATLGKKGEICDEPYNGEADGIKYFLTHSDRIALPVAESGLFDLVIFGHTHSSLVKKCGNTMLINPGELCGWVSGKRTIIIYDTKSRDAEVITL